MNATFTATVTKDSTALRYSGHSGTATFYRTDETGTDLYEVEFLDGEVILATATDLSWI